MEEIDIVKLCGGLSLTEEEEVAAVMDGVTRRAGEQKRDLCLGGKIMANKQVNTETFRINIPKIWRTNQGFEVEIIKSNTFVFHFKSLADKRRVMAGGPWHFDNHLLVLEELSEFGEVEVMKFCMVEFWIQLHNILICFTTKEASIFLGDQLGRLIDIDENEPGSRGGNSVRIRVEIDIRKPLKRFLKMDMSGKGDFKFLLVKYERLQAFCFHCGVIGHGDRECSNRLGADKVEKTKMQRQYGEWMRAESPQKKQYGRGWKEEFDIPLKGHGFGMNATEGQRIGKKQAMSERLETGKENSKGVGTGGRRIVPENSCQEIPNRSPAEVDRLEVASKVSEKLSEEEGRSGGKPADLGKRILEQLNVPVGGNEVMVACRGVEQTLECQEDMIVETEALIVNNTLETVTEESGNKKPSVNQAIQGQERMKVLKGKMQGDLKGLDNEPIVKGKWKKAARRAQPSSKEPQQGRLGNKRALEEKEELEKGCIKKLKEDHENMKSSDYLSAGLGESLTCREP